MRLIKSNKPKELLFILNYWFWFSGFMLIVTFILSFDKNLELSVFFINLVFLISFYLIVFNASHYSFRKMGTNTLIKTVFFYSIFFVAILKVYYFFSSGSLFELSAIDSLHYDYEAKRLIKDGIELGISNFLRYHELSDLGGVITTSISYLVYPSPLSYNIFNLMAGMLTVIGVFKIANYYMDRQYSFLCALTYGLSSFTVYLYSTGMKETFFVLILVFFVERMHVFVYKRTIISLFGSIILLISVILFRPAVFAMMLISIPLGFLLNGKQNIYSIFIIIIIILGFLYFYSYFIGMLDTLSILTQKGVVEEKQNLLATNFNYMAAFASAFAGPFPSYLPVATREQQAFYSTGLGFRVLLSVFSIYAFYVSFKEKKPLLLSLGIFSAIEMIVLSSILESFELRLDSPHIVFVYILSFYGLYRTSENKRLNSIANTSIIILSLFVLFWNLRF